MRESEKLKTELELCNMEIHQKKVGPDYHRLKTFFFFFFSLFLSFSLLPLLFSLSLSLSLSSSLSFSLFLSLFLSLTIFFFLLSFFLIVFPSCHLAFQVKNRWLGVRLKDDLGVARCNNWSRQRLHTPGMRCALAGKHIGSGHLRS